MTLANQWWQENKKMARGSAISWSLSVILVAMWFHSLPLPTWSETAEPTPAEWPHQFNALLFENSSGSLLIVDFWYDWSRESGLRVAQNQLGKLSYELAFNNGTSYLYPSEVHFPCWLMEIPPGILSPNWMQGARYHGQQYVDGFLCNVWERVGVVWYYEDVVTKRPVHWSWILFPGGDSVHVITFNVGAVLEDVEKWKVPDYCLNNNGKEMKASTF